MKAEAAHAASPDAEVNMGGLSDNRLTIMLADALAGQRDMLIAAEPDVLEDRDAEAVHVFRVAVRRARSLLKILPNLLNIEPSKRLRNDLTWIAHSAGQQRDLDVLTSEFELRARRLEIDESMQVMVSTRLQSRRDTAHRLLLRALGSARYGRLKTEWSELIDSLRALEYVDRKADAAVANLVRRDFDAFCRHARKIRQNGARRQLHELRTECKQLRYIIETFDDIWSQDLVGEVLDPLRDLQDDLGKYCDLLMQKSRLGELMKSPVSARTKTGMRRWLQYVDRRAERKCEKSIKRCHRFGRKRQRRVDGNLFNPRAVV